MLSRTAIAGLALVLSAIAPAFPVQGVEAAAPVVAQAGQERKTEEDRILQQCRQDLQKNQYEAAVKSCNQALVTFQQLKNAAGAGKALNNLGVAYYALRNYNQAIPSHEQSLAIARELKDRPAEARSLLNLSRAYLGLENRTRAVELSQQALAIARELKNSDLEKTLLQVLEAAQKPAGSTTSDSPQKAEADRLLQQGNQQYRTSQLTAAFQSWQQALQLYREIKDRQGEGNALGNLGIAYRALGNYGKAIEYQEQRLAIAREIKDRLGEGQSLGNLGIAYRALGNYGKAIEYQEQSLAIARELKDRLGEGQSLGNLGIAYRALGNYGKAIEYQEQALAILQEIKDQAGEGIVLSNIGFAVQQQQQPELAIIFYKQSVNVREGIRQRIRKLDRSLQESYANSVAGTYRSLADLLLAQGRVLEAQQALELLKVQELRDFTRDTRAGGETKGAPLNAIEAPVKPPFDTSIALGLKLTDCENQRPRCADRDQLLAQRQAAIEQFNQQKDRLRRLAQQQGSQDPAQLQQEELTVAAAKVVQAQPKTVLIYPLVLEDKLWLVYGVQAGKAGVVFASKEIPVSRKELSATVAQFRDLLENPYSDVKQLQQVSQKLYGWLIAPLRPQLDANGIQNLVFSLDRSTRYMPLAALFDGKQYLAERFTLSTILTAGLTNTTDKLSPNPTDNPVLGLGLSNPVAGFNPLPNVPAEIAAIVRPNPTATNGIFQGSAYLNQDFTLKAFKNLIDYRILHIATHGKFESEDPEQSFLVLGNGDRLKVPNIRQLSDLGNIHLAVLSACETAKGGQDKEGIEVAGLSYYFLSQNVKSVMASLWLVNDASTALLMQQFYKQLATGKVTKAEALRQAQLRLLSGNQTAKDAAARADIEVRQLPGTRRDRPANFSHPYYWAPFILIGNSL